MRLRLEIPAHSCPVWSCAASADGQFLATASADGVVCVWHVGQAAGALPLVDTEPLRRWTLHRAEVLSLTWAPSNFLLSASLDGDVRLWNPLRSECLGVFTHPSPVSAVCFNSDDDRIFFTTCLDRKLRRWDISRRQVVALDPGEQLTTLGFVGREREGGGRDGILLTGSYRGTVAVRQPSDLCLITAFSSRSQRGRRHKPHKVTGLCAGPRERTVLVTTSDSRLRLFSLVSYARIAKFRGHTYGGDVSQTGSAFVPPRSCAANTAAASLIAAPGDDGSVYLYDCAAILETDARNSMAGQGVKGWLRPGVGATFDMRKAYVLKVGSMPVTGLAAVQPQVAPQTSGVLGPFFLFVTDSSGVLRAYDSPG
ncbi:hypothetical protein KIPB_001764 [Kipferlia bialata]|uniref:Uncharacterized protein n=1 Tax=Kipferlia bialata TaxID=797122 RepID=A0A9K3CPE7_9EUKA|nr:hypothetical protein KIPB_001764 [Kipferlia bialata]|eukprot:g1764.t1